MERKIDLTTTLQQVRVPSLIVDRAGIITWLNNAGREAFGDVEGSSFQQIIPPDRIEFVQRQFDRKLEKGERVTDYTTEVLTRDGSRHPAEVSSVAIENGDRCHAVFGVVLVRDGHPTRSDILTPRQEEVLALIAGGASTVQIAQMLHLSTETVRNHVRQILRRLRVNSRVEAVAVGFREGIL
jgi:PAS domain S-box-containing protein